jgi:hypothetical protein
MLVDVQILNDTAFDACLGDWPAIQFSPGNFRPNVSKFDYATFEYGGGTGRDTIFNYCDNRGDVSGEVEFNQTTNGLDYDGPAITRSTFKTSAGNGVRYRCNVGRSGGCLNTDYQAPALNNTFTGFTTGLPAENPLTCP